MCPYENAEITAASLDSEEMAKEWIITLFKKIPELTEEQEKNFISLVERFAKDLV